MSACLCLFNSYSAFKTQLKHCPLYLTFFDYPGQTVVPSSVFPWHSVITFGIAFVIFAHFLREKAQRQKMSRGLTMNKICLEGING